MDTVIDIKIFYDEVKTWWDYQNSGKEIGLFLLQLKFVKAKKDDIEKSVGTSFLTF